MNGLDFKPFPLDKLPKPLARYAKEAAAAIGCDPAMVAVPMLAAGGGCIGSTRRIGIKRKWEEPAIVWAAIVAPSGSHKSPALDAAIDPIRDIQRGWMKDRRPETPDESEAGTVAPVRRILTTDTTIEALAPIMETNPRGLTVAVDELSTWMGSFDSYNSRGKAATRGKWLEIFGGRPVMIDRKGEKQGKRQTPIYIPYPAVSVFGGIQPMVLSNLLDSEDVAAGLDARLLLAAPPARRRRWTERDVSQTAENDHRMILERLLELKHDGDGKPRRVGIDPAAKAEFIDFYNANGEALDSEGDEATRACLSKLECYAARLALCFHCVNLVYNASTLDDWQDDNGPVTMEEMVDGIAVAQWFIAERGRLRTLKTDPAAAARMELADYIGRKRGRITAGGLHHAKPAKYPDSGAAELALLDLVKHQMGRWEQTTGTGHPTRYFVLHGNAELQESH